MSYHELLYWLNLSERRTQLVLTYNQPLTTKQVATRLRSRLDYTTHLIATLGLYKLITCLNPHTRHSRLYWLTPEAIRVQAALRQRLQLPPLKHTVPAIDYDKYAFVCYTNRQAVVLATDKPRRAMEIRRRALDANPTLRLSTNNCRDILKLLVKQEIMTLTRPANSPYPHFSLKPELVSMQKLLRSAWRSVASVS